MSSINETDNVDALQAILNELVQIEANVDMVTQAVTNINRNMVNYQYAINNINNINDEYEYNINNILPPPFYEPIEEEEESTIMDGILAEEEARRDEAARIIQCAWMTKKLYD